MKKSTACVQSNKKTRLFHFSTHLILFDQPKRRREGGKEGGRGRGGERERGGGNRTLGKKNFLKLVML